MQKSRVIVVPDEGREVGAHKDVETDADQLVEGEEAILLAPVQRLGQLHRPLLPVLLARIHDVLEKIPSLW